MLGVLQPGAPHVVSPTGAGDRVGAGRALLRRRMGARVHSTEDEAILDPLQRGDQVRVVRRVGVALPAGLVGAAASARLGGGQEPLGLG